MLKLSSGHDLAARCYLAWPVTASRNVWILARTSHLEKNFPFKAVTPTLNPSPSLASLPLWAASPLRTFFRVAGHKKKKPQMFHQPITQDEAFHSQLDAQPWFQMLELHGMPQHDARQTNYYQKFKVWSSKCTRWEVFFRQWSIEAAVAFRESHITYQSQSSDNSLNCHTL